MTALRFVGDAHGQVEALADVCRLAPWSVCVGDVGFRPDYVRLARIAPPGFRCILGNHDDYGSPPDFALGDFGVQVVPGFGSFFYVRGAFSIDWMYRTPGYDWFHEEELSDRRMGEVIDAYRFLTPDFVVTHDAPRSVIPRMGLPDLPPHLSTGPQRTPRLLDALLDIHRPRQWLFGHFHKSWSEVVDGTRFRCLNSLEWEDYDENQHPIGSGGL